MEIELIYNELIEKIKGYHPATRLSLIEDAYFFAKNAHKNQFRVSGEPYLVHPLTVAVILSDIEMDLETIAAGILHDVVEDTECTSEDITIKFGEEIASLVDGVTKLEKMAYTSKTDEQAENYRKMFLAMAKDLRVIIIKIADRLHNMRTLSAMAPEKQVETARETLEIYAPLAHRLGISKLRYQLEDLAFKHVDKAAYDDLANQILYKQDERQKFIHTIIADVSAKLNSAKINARVEGRPKHFFSIYKKMVEKERTLDQIYDLFAIRVLVDEVMECYEVLGVLHAMYTPVTGRFKDYIGMPKANRYQSLHTTLMWQGQYGEPFEVQIRTRDMHRVSEYGIAAHWKYKEGKGGLINQESEEAKMTWLREMLEWQREMSDNEEYLDALRTDLDVFKGHVYCFTPKGEVISLLSGANPIDFAYAIHSEVGNRMTGAQVNGKMVPLDYVIANGDRVEIFTGKETKGPSKDWLKMVKTSQARSKINQWFKKENRADNEQRGKELLEAEAKKLAVSLDELLDDGREAMVLEFFNYQDFKRLCAAIGYGSLKEKQVINRLHREYVNAQPVPSDEEIIQNLLEAGASGGDIRKKKSGIVVRGVGDVSVRFAKCCSPLPGDEIIGFVTRGRGMSIHRADCVNILNLEETEKQRIMSAEWQLPPKTFGQLTYHTDLYIRGNDRDGLLIDISRALSDAKVKVKTLIARTVRSDAVFNIGIEIPDCERLEELFKKIVRESGVQEIKRVIS